MHRVWHLTWCSAKLISWQCGCPGPRPCGDSWWWWHKQHFTISNVALNTLNTSMRVSTHESRIKTFIVKASHQKYLRYFFVTICKWQFVWVRVQPPPTWWCPAFIIINIPQSPGGTNQTWESSSAGRSSQQIQRQKECECFYIFYRARYDVKWFCCHLPVNVVSICFHSSSRRWPQSASRCSPCCSDPLVPQRWAWVLMFQPTRSMPVLLRRVLFCAPLQRWFMISV